VQQQHGGSCAEWDNWAACEPAVTPVWYTHLNMVVRGMARVTAVVAVIASMAAPIAAFQTPAAWRLRGTGSCAKAGACAAPVRAALPTGKRAGSGGMQLRMGLFDTLAKTVGIGAEETKVGSIGDAENRAIVDAYIARVEEKINPLEDVLEKVSDEELKAKTAQFKERLAKGETEDDILDEVSAATPPVKASANVFVSSEPAA
jgi:hypothetical protein